MQQLEEIEANSPDNAKRQAYAIKKQIEGLENKKITDKTVKEEENSKHRPVLVHYVCSTAARTRR